MKHLVNKPMTKKFKFMGEDVEVRKLSVGQVIEIQQMSKAIGEDEKASLELLQYVISSAVKDAKDLTPEDFMEFPIDELSKLSNEILSYSGLGNAPQK